jgi:hypothetical protein
MGTNLLLLKDETDEGIPTPSFDRAIRRSFLDFRETADSCIAKENGAVLLAAHALINEGRQASYGSPKQSFTRTAALWSAYLGKQVGGKDVAVCLALLKLSRESFRHKTDNLLDAAGYIGLAEDLAELEADRDEGVEPVL